VDRVLKVMSVDAKRLMVQALYLTGDEALADFLGMERHEPENSTTH